MLNTLKTCIAVSALLLAGAARADTPVTIQISNVTESDTQIVVTIFSSKKTWLKKPFMTESIDLTAEDYDGTVDVDVALPPGEYAFQVFHDVDGNGKMKTNFIGIPKEPVGVSNDAKGKFGPPKFKDAKIAIASEAIVVPIVLTAI